MQKKEKFQGKRMPRTWGNGLGGKPGGECSLAGFIAKVANWEWLGEVTVVGFSVWVVFPTSPRTEAVTTNPPTVTQPLGFHAHLSSSFSPLAPLVGPDPSFCNGSFFPFPSFLHRVQGPASFA